MNCDAAADLAVEALTYLVGDSARIERFSAVTGINPADIRRLAPDPTFLAAVLEYLMQDEQLLLAFAQEAGRNPSQVAQARNVLGGPAFERDIP